MYELYIANKNYSSWSLRPWVLMRELGIPFAERLNPFLQGSSWEAFRRFSPNGKVPCLHDRGTVVWDSLAIAEYLAERHDDVWPQSSDARSWSRCAAAEMHSGFAALRECCPMNCGVRVQLHDMPLALLKDLARLEALWSEGLERFGGPLTPEQRSAVDEWLPKLGAAAVDDSADSRDSPRMGLLPIEVRDVVGKKDDSLVSF